MNDAGIAREWRSYVLAPKKRILAPVRIIASSEVGVEHPDTLVSAEGPPTRLSRNIEGPMAWPVGTTVRALNAGTAGSAPAGGDAPDRSGEGTITAFLRSHGQEDAAAPAAILIQAPQPLTTEGITIETAGTSGSADVSVDAWDGHAWTREAQTTCAVPSRCTASFAHAVSTSSLRISVGKAEVVASGRPVRIADLVPYRLTNPYVDLDFGQVVAGRIQVEISGASSPAPMLRLAFSETRQFLSARSDFSRSDFSNGSGTDDHVPASGGETWTDTKGCQFADKVCADGLRGFRYVRVYLDQPVGTESLAAASGWVDIKSVRLKFTPYLGTPATYSGYFLSSDELLNRIWYGSTYTTELNIDTFDRDDVDPRAAWTPTLQGRRVLHDGAKRDRDPYIGDVAVSGLVSLIAHGYRKPMVNVLDDLAGHQRADGWIPPASINDYKLLLFDYPAWWVAATADYLLYTGDDRFGQRSWKVLTKLIDDWYPSVTNADGLIEKSDANGYGSYGDYAFLPRKGVVTYYNANYIRALQRAAEVAESLGHAQEGAEWRARARAIAAAANTKLWDAVAGAYLDTEGGTCHSQDANAFAVLAGIADSERSTLSLNYLARTLARPWGNVMVDRDCFGADFSDRVYAFINYPEVLARFRIGDDQGAIELLRRTWGWMLDHDPGNTTWEATGRDGDIANYAQGYSSMAHSWAAGAALALTNEVLGIRPTGNGFSSWEVIPHPGGLHWAEGKVPTPRGALRAAWRKRGSTFSMKIDSPPGSSGRIGLPTGGRRGTVYLNGHVVWDGFRAHRRADVTSDGRYVYISGLKGRRYQASVSPAAFGESQPSTRVAARLRHVSEATE